MFSIEMKGVGWHWEKWVCNSKERSVGIVGKCVSKKNRKQSTMSKKQAKQAWAWREVPFQRLQSPLRETYKKIKKLKAYNIILYYIILYYKPRKEREKLQE